MRKKILSVLMVMLLSVLLFNSESIEASNYNQKTKSIELINYYNTATDHTDSDVLYGSSNYVGEDDVTGTYEYGVGKNLFNYNTALEGWYIQSNGNLSTNSILSVSDYIEVEAGESYTSTYVGYVSYYDDSKTFISQEFKSYSIQSTITIPLNIKYVRFDYTNEIYTGGHIASIDQQFEKGLTVTTYESYYSLQGIDNTNDLTNTVYDDTRYDRVSYTDSLDNATDYYTNVTLRNIFGNTINDNNIINTFPTYNPLGNEVFYTNSGKNKFDADNISYSKSNVITDLFITKVSTGVNVDINISTVNQYALSDVIRLLPNTEYTISLTGETLQGTSLPTARVYEDDNVTALTGDTDLKGVGAHSIQFTTGDSGEIVIRFYANRGITAPAEQEYTNIQIEEGNTATSYEPVIFNNVVTPELHRIGSVYDDLVTQRLEKHIIESSDIISMNTALSNIDRAQIRLSDINPNVPNDVLSNTINNYTFVDSWVEGTALDTVDSIGKYYTSGSLFDMWFMFAKGVTIEQARTELNGKQLIYVLDTPIAQNGDYYYYNYNDGVIHNLTTAFNNSYLPTARQFDSLISAYNDVTANGEGIYEMYSVNTKQDDYTYVKLINVSDTHFEFNLTEAFGVNIPDIQEFNDNLIYDSVNNKYYYNVVTTDEDIIKLDCQYTATNLVVGGVMSESRIEDHIYYSSGQIDSRVEEGFVGVTNLIENGDFSDGGDNWTGSGANWTLTFDGVNVTSSNQNTSYSYVSQAISQDPSIYSEHNLYMSYDLYNYDWVVTSRFLINTPLTSTIVINSSIYAVPNEWVNINKLYKTPVLTSDGEFRVYFAPYGDRTQTGDVYEVDNAMLFDVTNDILEEISEIDFESNYLNGVTYIDGFSSDIVIDLTVLYGRGNEPTVEEFESVVDLSTVSPIYTLNDSCNVTMEEFNPMYQYETSLSSVDANISLSFVDTVYGLTEGEIEIVVEKYDLNMNYQGILNIGRVINDSDVNSDGFLEHTYNFDLPLSTVTENGYIYQVKNGEGGKLLTAGYYYDAVGTDFATSSSGIRTDFEAVGINDTVYNDTNDTFLFDPDKPLDYLFNDGDEFIIHYRFKTIDPLNLDFHNENTTQVSTIFLDDAYSYFSDANAEDVLDGYFIIELSEDFPMLLQYLYDNNVTEFNDKIYQAYNYYNSDIKGLFNDINYADNYGVYTYELNNGIDTRALGESPLFFMSSFNQMTLKSHLARSGNPFVVRITQPHDYLGDVYDNQYIYDTNTLVSNFELIINGDEIQDIYLDMFEGLSNETGIIRYYLSKTFDYKNGADNLAYAVYIEDTYNLKTPDNLSETRDKMLDQLGLNSGFGKVLISIVLIIIVAVFVYIKSSNSIVTMIASFLVLGLMFVLGFIEAWVILFVIIIILLIVYFVYSKTSV